MALAKALAEFEIGGARKRKPTVACETGGAPISRPVVPILQAEIADTLGAGDAFAGGFLAYFVKGATLKKCIDAGSYAAQTNLRMRGYSVPDA